jgi:hypothetical protein
MMQVIKTKNVFVGQERETLITFDGERKMWNLYAAIPKHFRRAQKYGWTPLKQWVLDDGTVVAMEFEAPERAISIKGAEKKKMSDKQMKNLFGDEDDE